MSYSTIVELRAAVNPSGGTPNPPTDPSNTAADLSNDVLTDALAEADSTIDSYIGGRYILPVALNPDSSVQHPLDFWSRNIAAYNATLTFRGSADFTDNDPIARRYNATMIALTAVRDGKASMPAGIAEIGSGTNTGSGAAGADAPFNPNQMALFEPQEFGIHNPGRTTFNPTWERPNPNWGWV